MSLVEIILSRSIISPETKNKAILSNRHLYVEYRTLRTNTWQVQLANRQVSIKVERFHLTFRLVE